LQWIDGLGLRFNGKRRFERGSKKRKVGKRSILRGLETQINI
jgi:hypothetical protein